MNQQFYSIENLKLVVSICKEYMNDKYGLLLDSKEEDANLKKVIYDIMAIVKEENKNNMVPTQDLNIDVLNRAKTYYVRKYNLAANKKPNIQNLSRDAEIFGKRQVNSAVIVPEMDPYNRKTSGENKDFAIDRIINERNSEIGVNKPVPDPKKLGSQINETAESTEDFMKKLQLLESERKKVDDNFEQKKHNDRLVVSMETVELNKQNVDDARKALFAPVQNIAVANVPDKFVEGKEFSVIPRNTKQKHVEKYLSINSFDRDVLSDPYRYSYSVNNIQNRYRNIDSISVSKVIIPDEIIQVSDSITFWHPYLLLQVKEFNDVYDGTNDAVRRSFCKLIFSKGYKGHNGRGYVVLKPMQEEKKTFYPAPLSSLNKLTISLLKPNGDLFNTSTDGYGVLQVTYNIISPNYIMITTSSYFEQNELYTRDCVVVKNYAMTKLSLSQDDFDIKTFNDYINSASGHEIMGLGVANANGYYNSFYIKAPGSFDRSAGQYVVNASLITCLNNYNAALVSSVVNGTVTNYSLQNTISMKMNVIVDDASVLDASKNFVM